MSDAALSLDGLKATLFQQDEGFRQMVSEHHALDERLRQLSTLPHLSHDEQIQEVALKKRKLALKDRIEATVRQSSPASSS
jgi:uncharacterized protein YdcH (DUF465 family)